ncbi:MAG: secondary thiamine-phosphate synthase enzyme YjbQ [Desulfarculaceae bacterium]|nr:secondary thiamine-phosphate synthase enzyme YjbQ [Desulfarculaceae bacterium]MCF8048772.1 secondary thiamine-phosphate synthase enzyme YjbQ [Desulfarculaceae bacterium]MCF8065206.1 secondary thiamine-phosphate synthase enzyme YjbQ [Desulfarculaceae bacterium]MCF8099159.1 secondary thiamine-phosphate synthase enzyme YjbQ [Desulfarculaceae bacterium]MCF8121996.1 secondary thiamine-phosphate synthase enzyme YjbQ [Desulfarculaceae bacterium]
MISINVKTGAHSQGVDITRQVAQVVEGSGVAEGWCEVFVPHTTAAVAVNEAADPDVITDIINTLDKQVPWQGDYRHAEGNSAAHVKSVLVGPTVRLPVSGGRLALGTWQGVFFMEFDGPRSRKAWVDVR